MFDPLNFQSYFNNYKFPFNVESLDNKAILITGGTGLFGVWLLSLFKFLNEETECHTSVIVLSRNPKKFLSGYPQFRDLPWLSWQAGDIREYFNSGIKCDFIIHAATDTSLTMHQNYENMFDTIFVVQKIFSK